MTFTEEQLQQVEKLAAITYTIKQMAIYFDCSPNDLFKLLKDKESKFYYHHTRGQLVAQAEIDMATLDSAKGQNLTATQALERIKQQRHFTNVRDQLLYDGND